MKFQFKVSFRQIVWKRRKNRRELLNRKSQSRRMTIGAIVRKAKRREASLLGVKEKEKLWKRTILLPVMLELTSRLVLLRSGCEKPSLGFARMAGRVWSYSA